MVFCIFVFLKYKNDVLVILVFNNYFKLIKLENIYNNFKIFRKESFRLEKRRVVGYILWFIKV